ncbi:Aste57867_1902 [Aphanomyces stellatus]|uniref:Aste57867_1902 protein n=1 Tax=Aphanomyces stellatus TaxID=120398 RepID=A0A485KBW6_9STRA|nr:hypothetical protein As57867_001900 [Aphanomyces stellatus]VFT79109.1 Aste57867_1902 [Aphanomyces stellatus]
MHPLCGAIGIFLQLLSIALLAWACLASAWTSVRLQVGFPVATLDLRFHPSHFCIGGDCFPYASPPLPSTLVLHASNHSSVADSDDTKPSRLLQQFVAATWCGCASRPDDSITTIFERAMALDMCFVTMQLCHWLLVALSCLALVSACATVLCLTYWKHEHAVGGLLAAAMAPQILGHGIVLAIWTYFLRPNFHPMIMLRGDTDWRILQADMTWTAPVYALFLNLAVLAASLWFLMQLALDQRRHYLNRLHVHTLEKHPLECPASYA